ncbi:TonB-dependent receptor [Geofilum rubicundum]|uniref:TonB-dependent receptor n=1 Tax=Geofilum rubicundum JCM 15548 TaxID=1236989 RepID=A0A0E9LQU7_9BACT|nr:TonB-dependent receptor [Geofilum rubicundum]MCH1437584.1 TonB-dependent receptor [Flavobacteriales bacterium]GAO27673.1 TonB-dependent receptor [Geofilum rubicundum JCM 15548]
MKYLISSLLFLFSSGIIFGQNTVSFEVKEESGESLIGASVVIEGTTNGTITNAEGIAKFENLPNGEIEFVISFVGYEEKEIELSFPEDNNKTIEVELEEGEELEEVVITSTRSSRTIQDIPTRIEAITGEELGEKAAMNSSNIGMLLRETTGVQMQQTSLSSGNMSIRIQGLDGRYTQILKDGMPLYGGFAGGLSIMQIPPLDLKQVELIKGSNSTLYGGGAIAGLVNLVTIKPNDEPKLDIMLNQTSALGTTGNIFYAQKYGKVGLSIYGSATNQIAYDPDDDGFSNMPDAQTFSLNPRFYYYINPNTELSVGLNTTIDDRTGGDMEVIKGNTSTEHVFTEKNKSERYATQLNFRNTKENRTIDFKNSISYFDRKLTIPDYRFNGNQVSSFSEASYNLHRNEKSEWQLGLNHYLEQFTEENTDSLPVRDYTHNTIGGFIQNTTDINEKWILEAGLRTDYNTDYGTFVLPRFSLLFKANNKLSSRIGGAMGYKLPTIFTEDAEKLYYRGIQPLSTDQVDAETSIGGNFDINYKTALGDEMTFSINQLFFLTQLKNALVLREDATTDMAYFESADGNMLSSGFETNIKLTYDDFKLYLNYAFVNTELQYDNINDQKPLTPKHNAGFVLFYEIEEKWSAGYEVYYTGKQFDNLYNQKTDYWTMGVMLMRHWERLSVFVNFENFTNVMQSDFEPLVLPPTNNPTFPDIWAPTDGFVFNGGIKLRLL